MDRDELVSLGSVDLRTVQARLEVVDGDLSMIVSDGDVEVELISGLGGRWEQAALGAERVATVAQQYADELRAHPFGRSRLPGGSGAEIPETSG